jgi:exonuclease III
MKLLSWNCRGLGKPAAIRDFKKILQTHKPDIVFLMETKLQSTDFHKKVRIPGDILPNSCIVDCIISSSNRSGGLAMLWSNDVKLDIIAYNERVIDCYITCSNNNERWRASGIYGYSNHHQKHQTCDIINNLYQTDNHANWLLFGDFNIVLNHAEKLGGRDINISLTNSFQNTLNIFS